MINTPTSSPTDPSHPFANSKSLLVLIPDKIDVEEESRLYDELCESGDDTPITRPRAPSPPVPPSLFSNDIWLGDNSGESLAFSRDVEIGGWTSVGDTPGGAHVVYDCAIRTKEGIVIHVHKRYTAFVRLYYMLRATLPADQQYCIPPLPPKSPLAKFRPAFLDHRRRLLQHWLAAILLHPDIGGCKAVRDWVME